MVVCTGQFLELERINNKIIGFEKSKFSVDAELALMYIRKFIKIFEKNGNKI